VLEDNVSCVIVYSLSYIIHNPVHGLRNIASSDRTAWHDFPVVAPNGPKLQRLQMYEFIRRRDNSIVCYLADL